VTTHVAGVDGYRGGWVVAVGEMAESAITDVRITVVETLRDVLDEPAAHIAVDVPIGLPDEAVPGGRNADRVARALLGPRKSSVFSPPVRGVLACETYQEALRVMRASSSHAIGLTKQCWNIVPKIREVDDVLRQDSDARRRIIESHPELCFAAMTGAPMEHRKATAVGAEERRRALRAVGIVIDTAAHASREVKPDDILDACACMWTARRRAHGIATHVPETDERDGEGLPMTIWA
jgi:predicted RNase H-like nuclease